MFTTTDRYPEIIARCAETTATPEHSSTTVLTRGNMKGSRTSIPFMPTGGQTAPMLIAGDSAP